MNKIFLVGFGGFVGSILRYLLSGFIHKLFDLSNFPLGTLLVNVSGCFIIGFLNGLAENHSLFSPEFRILVFIGLLGSFTTFSTFGYEVFNFARDGQMLFSVLNLVLHLGLGLGFVWGGYSVSKII